MVTSEQRGDTLGVDGLGQRRASSVAVMSAIDALRLVARSRAMVAVGPLAALIGAGLAAGIMWYEAVANGVDYTVQSWVLIGPIWALVALSWLLMHRWPLPVAVPFGVVTGFAAVYFNDVYGQFPAGGLLMLGAVVVLAHWPQEHARQ